MSDKTTPAPAPTDIAALAQALKGAIEETAGVKQIPISKYRAKTPWNPTGEKKRPKLNCPVYQNGREVKLWHSTDRDIELMNQLKPGRYLDRKVEVIEREGNGTRALEIRYSNANVEQRMNLKNHFRSFTELLEKIVAEHKPAKAKQ